VAKLKAPLMSLGASGQLGKTLVFFGWKGLDVVREYVVPANPQTALQVIQRSYFTTGVAMVHTAQARATKALDEVDQIANSTLASAKGIIMTWFNQVVKLWVKVKVAGYAPIVYSGIDWLDLDVTAFRVELYLNEETPSALLAGKFYFGTRKTNLIHSTEGDLAAGVKMSVPIVDLSAFLTAGVKYYMQFKPASDDPSRGADSGIYSFVAE